MLWVVYRAASSCRSWEGYERSGITSCGRASGANVGPGSQVRSASSLISPAVMLSPNAMKFVAPSTGVGAFGTSVTMKEQAAVRAGDAASVPLHSTVVAPSGNAVPEVGEQLIETGSTPPVWPGEVKSTACVGALTFANWRFDGQLRASGATGSGGFADGWFGE